MGYNTLDGYQNVIKSIISYKIMSKIILIEFVAVFIFGMFELPFGVYVVYALIASMVLGNILLYIFMPISPVAVIEKSILDKQPEDLVEVKREGFVKHIYKLLIVPGDIVTIRACDVVPADGRLIQQTISWWMNQYYLKI